MQLIIGYGKGQIARIEIEGKLGGSMRVCSRNWIDEIIKRGGFWIDSGHFIPYHEIHLIQEIQ